MNRVVLLDTGVLGLLVHPHNAPEPDACRQWLASLLADGDVVALPEIADYELRRELLRRFATTSIRRLNALQQQLVYLPLTTPILYRAAELWAQARNRGHITAPDPALDGDVILAAQALEYLGGGMGVVIATTNVKHLAFFTDARLWTDIYVGQP